jgi:hypothetical protein
MSQGTQGLDIQNVSGANYRQYVNEALKQVATMSSGATAPSNPQQQQLWFDTNNSRVKIYLGTAWTPYLLSAGDNAALGINALQSNTTGYANTAIGAGALFSNTIGIYNTAVGANAIVNNTTGTHNTAVGGGALSNNTTGTYNTAVGLLALASATGGSNTAVGGAALYSNTTGTNNTAIGFYAGTYGYGINITTHSNHVILGNSNVTDLICADTTISGHSDARDKKDIEALDFSGLAYINALIPRKFTWNMRKCVGSKKDITEIGFIAQEVESVQNSVYAVPGVVSTYDVDYTDPETNETIVTDQKLIAPARLIPILVKAIQELTVRVELLETALQAQ